MYVFSVLKYGEVTMRERSFFEAVSRRPYYISCSDYETKFSGIKALHHLCHALNLLGEEAYLVGATKESLKLRTPLLRESDILRHRHSNLSPIIVYPEIVSGNPLQLPNVVRWLLNSPGHIGGEESFDDSELLFAYSTDFVPENTLMPILRIPVVDNSIFNNIDNPNHEHRQGSCFYANKFVGYFLY